MFSLSLTHTHTHIHIYLNTVPGPPSTALASNLCWQLTMPAAEHSRDLIFFCTFQFSSWITLTNSYFIIDNSVAICAYQYWQQSPYEILTVMTVMMCHIIWKKMMTPFCSRCDRFEWRTGHTLSCNTTAQYVSVTEVWGASACCNTTSLGEKNTKYVTFKAPQLFSMQLSPCWHSRIPFCNLPLQFWIIWMQPQSIHCQSARKERFSITENMH